MLIVQDLQKSYGEKRVLQEVYFQAKKGELIGVIGINGAGKTTLFQIMLGHIAPDSGSVFYNGKDLEKHREGISKMGSLLEPQFFPYLSVMDNLLLLQKAAGYQNTSKEKEKIQNWLSHYDLLDKASAKVKELSFGQKQRIGLIQAMNHNPEVLILDEPFVGLDPHGKAILKKDLHQATQAGQMVFCSSHDLYDIGEIADRILYLKDGVIAFDGVFSKHKSYRIHFSSLNEIPSEFHHKILSLDSSYQQEIPFVTIDDIQKLDQTMTLLGEYEFEINDISVIENSLHEFFKEGAFLHEQTSI